MKWAGLEGKWAGLEGKWAGLLPALDRKVELELGWKLLLRVEAVGEVDSANATVGVDLPSRHKNIKQEHTIRKGNKNTNTRVVQYIRSQWLRFFLFLKY